jgi:hypothetical protein
MDCWKRSKIVIVVGREKECLAHMIMATYGIISVRMKIAQIKLTCNKAEDLQMSHRRTILQIMGNRLLTEGMEPRINSQKLYQPLAKFD